MSTIRNKNQRRQARHARIRAKVSGTASKPRMTVFRSNNFLYVQLVDDVAGKTIAAADTRKIAGANATEKATALGKAVAEKAKKAGIDTAVFDRGGYQYQGNIKALAEAARNEGLTF